MSTKKMLAAYVQSTPAPMFLTSLFTAAPENFHNSEEIEIDIQRDAQNVAVPVGHMGDGYQANQSGGFTTKKFTPPAYLEQESIHALQLMGRTPGRTDYDNPDFQAAALDKALRAARVLEKKIRLGMELQASQILTTGAIDLKNAGNVTVYAESFGAKPAHFFNSGVAWSGAADPLADITAACDLVNNDSLEPAVQCIMGAGSLEAALAITSFRQRFEADTGRFNVGNISPSMEDAQRGGQRVGAIYIGGNWLEVWTYNGAYKNPVGGTMTKYVPNDKVIVRAAARMDATFGGIPTFGSDGRAARFIPGRIINSQAMTDIQMNAWISPDGSVLNIGLGARPLMIPTAIDSFACIDTQI